MGKPTLMFIYHLIWRIDTADIRLKYELLSEKYHGLMLYLSSGTREQAYGDFRCLSYPFSTPLKRLFTYPLYCIKMAKSLKKLDAIITYDPLLGGLIGYTLKCITGARLIVEVNGFNLDDMRFESRSWFTSLKIRIAPIIMRFVLNRADAVKFVSTELQESVERYLELTLKRKLSFFDFVPSSVFTKKPSSNQPYIFTAGYPFNRKGIDVLIRAFNLITNEFPGIKLKIVGFCEDLSLYYELAAGNQAIEFHKPMNYEQIIPVFENCLFFVLASRSEGMGRVLIEAMASGKPVIGSNVGGIPGVIRDGINGFLFESENHEMLADKIRMLLCDDRLLKQMGDASYRIVQECYTPESYIENYHNLIQQVLSDV